MFFRFIYILYIRLGKLLSQESHIRKVRKIMAKKKKRNGSKKWGYEVNWHDELFWDDGKEKNEKRLKKGINQYKSTLDRNIDSILDEIEYTRMRLFEVDKRVDRKHRTVINGKEKEFYYSIQGIKERKKISDKWTKIGFLDTVIAVLGAVIPIVKTIALKIAEVIGIFLRTSYVKEVLPVNFITKLVKVHDLALCV